MHFKNAGSGNVYFENACTKDPGFKETRDE